MSDISALTFVQAPPVPDTVNVMLYGPFGSGKSTAAATAPGPILWVNCQGPGALAFPRKVASARHTTIDEVRIDRTTTDPVGVFRHVLAHLRDNPDDHKSIVIDTIGNLRELFAKQIVVGPASKTRDQWGDVAKVIREGLYWLRDRDINTIWIAHEDVSDVDDDRIVRPKIGGALTEDIPSEMDIVGYCGAQRVDDTIRYMAQLVEGRGRRGKDRSNGLGTTRELDLTEWLATYRAALAPDDSDMPWTDEAAVEKVKAELDATDVVQPELAA